MKKIILNMLLLSAISITAAAQAYDANPMANTPANQIENNAYYKAVQNVYYNDMYRSHWVWDKTSSTWVKRVELVAPAPLTPFTNTGTQYNVTFDNNNAARNNTVRQATKPGGQ